MMKCKNQPKKISWIFFSAIITCLFIVPMAGVPATAAEIKKGGTMVMILGGDLPAINPGITTDIHNLNISGQIFDTVIRLDLDNNPQPNLAKSWEISPDGKTYTFKFHPNIKWHDGIPFTSEDVAYGLLEINRKYNGQASTAFKAIQRIETPDKLTAIFKLEYAYPPLLRSLGYITFATILPKHLFEGTDPRKSPHNFKPVGTGPFIFKEYKKGSHIILERNPNYFQKGLPYLDRIIGQIIPNKAARVLALEKGDADFLPYFAMPFSEVKRLVENPNITVSNAERPNAGEIVGFMNLRNKPYSEKNVRQAIAHAVNRDEILRKAVFGFGKISAGPISSLQKVFWTDKGKQYSYDKEKAEKLLDEAGFPRKDGGLRFTMRLSYDRKQNAQENTAEIMKANLKEVGIEVKIQPMDAAAWKETAFIKWDFDMTLGSFATGPDPAIGTERLYVCRNIQRLFARNVTGYCNPELDKIFEAASRELDDKKRVALYHQAQMILAEDIPIFWIWDRYYPLAHNKDLIGLPADPTQHGSYAKVGWKK